MKIPALLTSRSIRPKCLRPASTALMAVSFLLTSPSTRTRLGQGLRSFDLLIVRGGTHDTPAAFEQCLCDAQADSAGSAGDDGDGLLIGIHRMSFWLTCVVEVAFTPCSWLA